MIRKMLRSKIHRAVITQCDLEYVGSITIDADLLREVDIRPNEAVCIYDIDNGARFETYVIRGESSSGVIAVNGAAARLVKVGHRIIIACFGQLHTDEIDRHVAKVVVVNGDNQVIERLKHDSLIDDLIDQSV